MGWVGLGGTTGTGPQWPALGTRFCKDALQKNESFKKLQITQYGQTDLGDQTDQTNILTR